MPSVSREAISGELRRAVKEARISASQLAAATGADPSTARRWLRGESSPTGDHKRRCLEVVALLDRLRRVFGAEFISAWLARPVPRLNDHRPIDVLAADAYHELSTLVGAFEEMPIS